MLARILSNGKWKEASVVYICTKPKSVFYTTACQQQNILFTDYLPISICLSIYRFIYPAIYLSNILLPRDTIDQIFLFFFKSSNFLSLLDHSKVHIYTQSAIPPLAPILASLSPPASLSPTLSRFCPHNSTDTVSEITRDCPSPWKGSWALLWMPGSCSFPDSELECPGPLLLDLSLPSLHLLL